MESVTTSQINISEKGKNKRNKSEGHNSKKEEKAKSKVTITKKTETSDVGGASGSGSIRLRFIKGGASKEETKDRKTKIEGNKVITTTTSSKVETNEGGDGNVAKVKKFRSHRMFKK